jgi:hypothetical protein
MSQFTLLKKKRTGNYKPGPGRPPGRKNNNTLELEAAVKAECTGHAGAEENAHEFLAAVYRDSRPCVRSFASTGNISHAIGSTRAEGRQVEGRHVQRWGGEGNRARRAEHGSAGQKDLRVPHMIIWGVLILSNARDGVWWFDSV